MMSGHAYKLAKLGMTLGTFPKQRDLAKFLNVTPQAVSQYPHDKKELMLHGLWVLQYINKEIK